MDRIAHMLNKIKNASMVSKESVEVPYTQLVESVAKVLKEKGFLEDVKVFKPSGSPFKMINLTLKYENGLPRVTDLKRVSKPGRRIYKGGKELTKVVGGYGVSVVSTSQGVLDGAEARKRKLGGEVLCEIW